MTARNDAPTPRTDETPIATNIRELADIVHSPALVDIARKVETLERELAAAREDAARMLT